MSSVSCKTSWNSWIKFKAFFCRNFSWLKTSPINSWGIWVFQQLHSHRRPWRARRSRAFWRFLRLHCGRFHCRSRDSYGWRWRGFSRRSNYSWNWRWRRQWTEFKALQKWLRSIRSGRKQWLRFQVWQQCTRDSFATELTSCSASSRR